MVPEQALPVLDDDQLRTLLEPCKGNDFVGRRDNAIIRLLTDTGGRLSEIAELTVNDVDFDAGVCHVIGKGRRPRALPFGQATALALGRYLRSRAKDKHAGLDALWLAESGRGRIPLQRRRPAAAAPRERARPTRAAPAHVPAHRCPPVARPRRRRIGPDASLTVYQPQRFHPHHGETGTSTPRPADSSTMQCRPPSTPPMPGSPGPSRRGRSSRRRPVSRSGTWPNCSPEIVHLARDASDSSGPPCPRCSPPTSSRRHRPLRTAGPRAGRERPSNWTTQPLPWPAPTFSSPVE